MKHLLPALCLLVLLTSCVSKTKYDSLLMANSRTQLTRDSLLDISNQLPAARQSVEEMTTQLRSLKRNYESAKSRNIGLQNNYDEMQMRYEELHKQNESLLNNSSQQVSNLTSKLAAREKNLDSRERQLSLLQDDLKQKELALSEVNVNYADYERRIKALEASISKNQAQMSALQAKINQALKGFNASDLQVTERNGKIYVSLSQGLLFASGSDQIDKRGLEAIDKLGNVLKLNPDVAMNVEGHTDSDGTVEKNWDLSVRRATAVVKRLTKAGCEPKQLTASGRALYDPIAENDSAENKSLNRRTEIIISPKLDELMQLIEK